MSGDIIKSRPNIFHSLRGKIRRQNVNAVSSQLATVETNILQALHAKSLICIL